MGYRKPIPVEINKIVIGEKYYTCSWTGVIAVIVLKVYQNTNTVVVKVNSKKKNLESFVRPVKYIFDNPEMARSAGRDWEHDERKRKKMVKQNKKKRRLKKPNKINGLEANFNQKNHADSHCIKYYGEEFICTSEDVAKAFDILPEEVNEMVEQCREELIANG